MYGIFTYIYHKNQSNVGYYTSPMDGMGNKSVAHSNHPPMKKCLFQVQDGIKLGGGEWLRAVEMRNIWPSQGKLGTFFFFN